MSQNDVSDDETGLQTPRVFVSATSHGCNSGTHKDVTESVYAVYTSGLQIVFSHYHTGV